jgi:hypothetical protein
MSAAALLALCGALFGSLPGASSVTRPGASFERGVALGLFSEDPSFDYRPLLAELKEHGATHVSIVWVWWQDDLHATEIRPLERWSAPDAQVLSTMREARELGLWVTAFPILRLARAARDEWRGRVAPDDEDRWWASYQAFMLDAAKLALGAGAERLAIGSELVSREAMRMRWLQLIDAVRLEAPALELMYSANWDHFEPVSFWDQVDTIGLSAYFELGQRPGASVAELEAGWAPVRERLEAWSARIDRPLVITEIGCPSRRGGALHPWDDERDAPIDLEEQRRAYLAFVHSWAGAPRLAGVYFWNWFGPGGETDPGYTPRGKPAARVLRDWYAQGSGACSTRSAGISFGRCDGKRSP